jgi:two-component system sensor histidine kinase UhpB
MTKIENKVKIISPDIQTRSKIKSKSANIPAKEEIAMLAHALRSINECVSITDRNDKILFVNESFLKTYGYNENELIGKNIKVVRAPIKLAKLVGNKLPTSLLREWKGELWNKRKDGDEFPIYLSSATIYDKNNKPLGQIGVATDITDRKIAEEKIKETKIQIEELYKHLNDVRENERAGISREIHDELGQSLTAIKMDLEWTIDHIGNTRKVRNKLFTTIDLVSATIKRVQKISSDLRPGILDDLGMNSAIEWFSGEFEKRSGLVCHLELEEIPDINSNIQLTLFRIVQEALTNIVRHANAKIIDIKTFLSRGKIYLKINDDGIGISKENMKSKKSLGLMGMKERLKQFNGTLEIISSENKGACLVICIPVAN